jgi:regulator of sigma E protease
MAVLENIWWFLVLIGVMILLHELGHFLAARFFDVKVETFSFGFGPRLFGFRRGETDFRFSAILFGGYVKMAGDQPGEENSADPRNLLAKPRWQRLIITFAGPFVNVLLAVGILTGLYMERFPKIPTPPDPVVGYVTPDGAAAKAGLRPGDRVVQIDNTANPNWDDITLQIISSARRPIPVWVERDGHTDKLTLVPQLDEKQGVGILDWTPESEVDVATISSGMPAQRAGLKPGDILVSANGIPLLSIYKLDEIERATAGQPLNLVIVRDGARHQVTVKPEKTTDPAGSGQSRWMIGLTLENRFEIVKLPFARAFVESLRENARSAKLIFESLERMIERRISPKSLVGPVGIAQLSGETAREGPAAFLSLMCMVSLNLAIFNLLPIPILDGGVIMMLLVEMLMRRDLDLKIKEAVVKVGFVFLMITLMFVIYNDISKILPG